MGLIVVIMQVQVNCVTSHIDHLGMAIHACVGVMSTDDGQWRH